jgi:hypothetical protein
MGTMPPHLGQDKPWTLSFSLIYFLVFAWENPDFFQKLRFCQKPGF